MKLVPINEFSNTADTICGPIAEINEHFLTITYTDYKNDIHIYRLSEILSFRIECPGQLDYSGFSDDDQAEVCESSRIIALQRNGYIGEGEIARHILIGFNANGGTIIDIIFSGQIETLTNR